MKELPNETPIVPSGSRDAAGKFLPGNKLAAGNPMNMKMSRLRAGLLSAIEEADISAVIRKLVEQAKSGDVSAAKVLLERIFGRPHLSITVERDKDGDTLEMRAQFIATMFGHGPTYDDRLPRLPGDGK